MNKMPIRAELDRLAMACEVCAGNDEGSLDDHLAACPACQEHAAKAEEMNALMKETHDLASRPEDERRTLMAQRMADIRGMPRAERVSTITDLTDAIAELNEEERDRVVKTRTDLMTTLSRADRKVMLDAFEEVAEGWDDDRKRMELRAITNATRDYPLLKRRVVRRIFNGMLG